MTISISVDSALATLNRLADHPLSNWLASVAVTEKSKAVARIQDTKKDPEGNAWAPWRPSTEYYRFRKGNTGRGLLWDEGTLLASFVSGSTNSTAFVGTPVEYAEYLQDGTFKMVSREFLGWNKDTLALMELDAAIALARIR